MNNIGKIGAILCYASAGVVATGNLVRTLADTGLYSDQEKAYENLKYDRDIFECQKGKALKIKMFPKPEFHIQLIPKDNYWRHLTTQSFRCDDGTRVMYNLALDEKTIAIPVSKLNLKQRIGSADTIYIKGQISKVAQIAKKVLKK